MSTGILFASSILSAMIGLAIGSTSCARADMVGPGDPGAMPCAMAIDWTVQRQPPAAYRIDPVDQLLPPVEERTKITTFTLPPIKDGGDETPVPIWLGAAITYLAGAIGALAALAISSWRRKS